MIWTRVVSPFVQVYYRVWPDIPDWRVLLHCLGLSRFSGFWGRFVCEGVTFPWNFVVSAFYIYIFRFLESHWFVWTTQMNHIPMDISRDQDEDWVTAQLKATCNVDQSFFNDWFSGHLNFQIEHQWVDWTVTIRLAQFQWLHCTNQAQNFCGDMDMITELKEITGAFMDSCFASSDTPIQGHKTVLIILYILNVNHLSICSLYHVPTFVVSG